MARGEQLNHLPFIIHINNNKNLPYEEKERDKHKLKGVLHYSKLRARVCCVD